MPELTERSFDRRRLVLYVAAAVGIAVAGYLLYKLISASDEPPIRVKRGSLVFQLATTANVAWQPASSTSRDDWSHNGSDSSTKTYWAEIKTNGDVCPAIMPHPWKRATVTYSDGTQAVVQHNPSRSWVTVRGGTPNGKLLEYKAANDKGAFIQKLELQGGGQPWECRFSNTEQFVYLLLCPTSVACVNATP